ncbi:collagen alpha-4(VI) chain-like isoform X2 [Haliotis rubra]|uniref:collagen alpha-4(VI) chain-like isoform X2 n=1 Tax=Haliotis rubra TaxID=36100 RepID=UPI001EE5A42F|nr:collagen alpha-4(VI) chain-like isoform X2 [Haliotis rubra]
MAMFVWAAVVLLLGQASAHEDDSAIVNNTLTECRTRPADIVFLLDSSSSEGQDGFTEQVKFIYNVTKAFNIGPGDVQVSVVVFATSPFNQFFLNEYSNKTDVLAAINSVIYQPGNTQTDDGLAFVFHNSFLPIHGGRNDSEKIIIVLTDGQSTDTINTASVANQIHNTDIQVISIGIGSAIDKTELATIATDNEHMYLVANFSVLFAIVDEVAKETCTSTELVCRSNPADILFLLDTSSSEGTPSFNIQLEFVKNFTKDFEIGPDNVQIAAATFSDTTQPEFWYNDYHNSTSLLAAIGRIMYRSGNTHTEDALRFASTEGFTAEHGARNDSSHIIIILSDGQSIEKSQTKNEAEAIHSIGIQVIAIGIGVSIDQQELRDIASGSGDQNAFSVANFDALRTIELPIQRQTCEVQEACGIRPSDIVFLLDTFNSGGEDNFKKQLQFVNNFASKLIIGADNVQISVVSFLTSWQTDFPLNQFSKKQDLLNAITQLPYQPGNTPTDDGLLYVSQNSFQSGNGARPNANQMVVVVTDRVSANPSKTAAQAVTLHDKGIKVIAVGIGPIIDNDELNNIASGDAFVFKAVDVDALLKMEKDIRDTTCKTQVMTCSTEPTEIVFLLDSSSSEGSVNFKKQLSFVSNFIDGFDISPNAVQVALVTFSTVATNRFFLNDYMSKASLKSAISRTPYNSGNTHTGNGLEFVRQSSLSPKHGARPGSKKVVIVMTDGQSQQKLLTANQGILLRKEGVMVISIGIGAAIDQSELAVIASDDKHMVKVSNFDNLNAIEQQIQDIVCSDLVCASTPADIMFVLDSSASIGPFNFNTMLNFITNFVRKFDVGTSAVQFGVVAFANDVNPQFDLGRYKTRAEVIAGINDVRYHYGGTYTEKALEYVRTTSFTSGQGSRSEATKIAIVLTDGQSNSVEKTKAEAQALHAAGIEVISIGIGSSVNVQELTNIATNVSYVFSVATFDALYTIQAELLQATCRVQVNKPPATVKPGPCVASDSADVIFLLDSSNSEGPASFQQELDFVVKFVDDFPIGPNDFQFGIITYASNARMQISLNDNPTESDLRLAILQVVYDGGLTYTNQALELARTVGFSDVSGARNGTSKFVIVVTDGASTAPAATLKEAELLKADGVNIITVGVGKHVPVTMLQAMATDSTGGVFLVNSFEDLQTREHEVELKLCSELRTTPSSVVTSDVPKVPDNV